MAKNPMQRKAQNSFLLGMLITLLITGAIIALLVVQLTKLQNTAKKEQNDKIKVCVLNADVKSGQVITQDLVEVKSVNKDVVPSNSFVNDVNNLNNYSFEDITGTSIETIKVRENENTVVDKLALPITNENEEDNEIKYRIIETTDNENYYYKNNQEAVSNKVTTKSGTTEEERDSKTGKTIYKVNTKQGESDQEVKVDIRSIPIIAKVEIKANSVITSSLITKSDEKVSDDIRKVEYNMIELPSQIESGQYIDIRLKLPNGTDFIVVSDKQVTIPEVDGVPSLNTISLNMSETEILTLSCAIVECYKIEGSILYASEYVEPGLQTAAKETYLPNEDTILLIRTDPNCVVEAANAIISRFNSSEQKNPVRNPIQSGLNQNAEQATDNAVSNLQAELQKAQEERQKYLESLGGSY